MAEAPNQEEQAPNGLPTRFVSRVFNTYTPQPLHSTFEQLLSYSLAKNGVHLGNQVMNAAPSLMTKPIHSLDEYSCTLLDRFEAHSQAVIKTMVETSESIQDKTAEYLEIVANFVLPPAPDYDFKGAYGSDRLKQLCELTYERIKSGLGLALNSVQSYSPLHLHLFSYGELVHLMTAGVAEARERLTSLFARVEDVGHHTGYAAKAAFARLESLLPRGTGIDLAQPLDSLKRAIAAVEERTPQTVLDQLTRAQMETEQLSQFLGARLDQLKHSYEAKTGDFAQGLQQLGEELHVKLHTVWEEAEKARVAAGDKGAAPAEINWIVRAIVAVSNMIEAAGMAQVLEYVDGILTPPATTPEVTTSETTPAVEEVEVEEEEEDKKEK